MSWYWYVLLAFIVFIFLLVISEVKIKIVFNKHSKNDFIEVNASFFYNLVKFNKKIPLIVMESFDEGVKYKSETDAEGMQEKDTKNRVTASKVKSWQKRFKQLIRQVTDMLEIVKKFLKHIHIDLYKWETVIGVGDAMDTGMSSGIIWGIKGVVLGVVSNYLQMNTKPQLVVNPQFNDEVFHTRFECIVRFRIGHLIITGIYVVFKYFQGGRKKWQENILFKA